MIAVLRRLLLGLFLAAVALLPVHAEDAERARVLVMLRLPPAHFEANAAYGGGYGAGAGQAARRRIAARLAQAHGLTLVTGWPMPVLGMDCYVMEAPVGRTADEVAASLTHEPGVAWSEPMHIYRAQGEAPVPNDPLYRLQPAARAWRVADLHQVATGRNVKVAVIDSRIDLRHPDLIGQVQVSRDFLPDRPGEPERHGTGVAGIIAAIGDNHKGVVGVAPGARLMALRACWQDARTTDTLCDSLGLAMALSFAIDHGAQVINLSLSGPSDRLLGALIDAAIAKGATVVGAVDPHLAQGGFPASHAGVVAVASDEGRAAPRGVYLAPGDDIPTTQPGGKWSLVSGSSYAAAHVTGLFALLKEKNLRPGALQPLVVTSAGGAIDACASLMRGAPPCGRCGCVRQAGASAIARP